MAMGKHYLGKSIWGSPRVKKTKTCWIWQGSKNQGGYGQLQRDKVVTLAHRLSYMDHRGPIPKGMVVCHKCDRPSCVNPDHLFLGTYQDNVKDMLSKKRAWYQDLEKRKAHMKKRLRERKARLLLKKAQRQ